MMISYVVTGNSSRMEKIFTVCELRSNLSSNWLDENIVQFIDWPSNYPDQIIIEIVWGIMERKYTGCVPILRSIHPILRLTRVPKLSLVGN